MERTRLLAPKWSVGAGPSSTRSTGEIKERVNYFFLCFLDSPDFDDDLEDDVSREWLVDRPKILHGIRTWAFLCHAARSFIASSRIAFGCIDRQSEQALESWSNPTHQRQAKWESDSDISL